MGKLAVRPALVFGRGRTNRSLSPMQSTGTAGRLPCLTRTRIDANARLDIRSAYIAGMTSTLPVRKTELPAVRSFHR